MKTPGNQNPRLSIRPEKKHWPGYQHEVYKQSCVTEGFGGTL